MDQLITPVDRITDLPWEILDNILGRVPISDAVGTSILSTKWKDKWADLSKLVVDDCSAKNEYGDWDKLAKVVYHLLLSHRGHIEKFMLSTESFTEAGDLDNWIHFLSGRNIKELILDLHSEYVLPYSLFFCQQLHQLSITGCSFNLPPGFTGFSNLVSLEVKRFIPDDCSLESLISSCPFLEALILSFPYHSCSLIINAPNLKYLYVEGDFYNIKLENSPRLTDASFKTSEYIYNGGQDSQGITQNLVQPFGCLSPFEKLTMSGYFLRFLAARKGVPIPCDHLKVLQMYALHLRDLEEISVALSILRKSSNLKELQINVAGPVSDGVYDILNTEVESNWCFNKLRVVDIHILEGGMYGEDDYNYISYLKFISLLLASSPVLEMMIVRYMSSDDRDLWFMRKLLSFNRASTQLVVKFKSTFW